MGVLLVLFLLLFAVRSHDAQPILGDEPHYLVITYSLILDGSFNVKPEYVDRGYLGFDQGAPLGPAVNTTIFTPKSPRWYSQHGAGLPVLLTPFVWAAGVRGARVCMVLVALLVLLLTFLWTRHFSRELWLAGLATAVLAFSPAFLALEGRIFPDLPTAALLLGCLLLLEGRRRPSQLLLLSLLVGASPWVQFKNALAFGTVAGVAVVLVARETSGAERMRRLLLVIVPALASLVVYELTVRAWYGSWLPTKMYPPGNEEFAFSPARGVAAASFDSARGLVTLDPALILILAGLPVWMRLWRGPFLRLALVVGPSILLQATFNDWAGGDAPAASYELQFVPALVPAIALLLRAAPAALRLLAAALIGLQFALAAAFLSLTPAWGWAGERSPFLAGLDARFGVAFDNLMPTFGSTGGLIDGEWKLVAWILASCALLAWGALLARRTHAPVPAVAAG